jgi:phenylacetate-coenzyme A ligase PaaK-like adenylate-forming protein
VAAAGFFRETFHDVIARPDTPASPNAIAFVAADKASHMTSAISQTFTRPGVRMARFPVTRPLDEIVAGLNAFQPASLAGYPSALAVLAREARGGGLRIHPRRIVATSEPLLPEARGAIETTFGAPVANVWGTSEAGPMAIGCWRRAGMHVCDDLVIIEPVDRAGRPVDPGTRSDKVYVTAISNPTLPLIRFEITDQATVVDERCPCGSAHRLVADVEGRLDDVFTYADGVVVHPHVVRSVLSRDARIVEYQVQQADDGGRRKDESTPVRNLGRLYGT